MPIFGNDQLAAIQAKDLLENATYGLSAIETLVDDLESRLTVLRAGKLDRDIAEKGDIQTERGTDNALLAASYTTERGTDNGLLAANYLGHQFSPYNYDTELAADAKFVPANKTIMMGMWLVQAAAGELSISRDTAGHNSNYVLAENVACTGIWGAIMFSGYQAIYNTSAASKHLRLWGLSMA